MNTDNAFLGSRLYGLGVMALGLENALNLALVGVAWVVADSTAGRSR